MYLEGQFRLLCSAVTITHISLQYKIENINLYFSAEIKLMVGQNCNFTMDIN